MASIKGEIYLLEEHWEAMRQQVMSAAPEEACGLLGGLQLHSMRVFPVENALHSPVRFRMDPQAQVNALLDIEAQGWELLAIYHSHPSGPPYPSPTDIAEAAYPEAIVLIWQPIQEGWTCRAYQITADAWHEIHIKMG